MKSLFIASIMASTLTLATPLYASAAETTTNGSGSGSCPCSESLQKMADTYSLDSAQKDKIKAIQSSYNDKMNPLKDEMQTLRKQIHDVVLTDKLDETKLDSLISKKTDVMNKMMKLRMTMKHEVYMVLTKDQQTQFKATSDKWMKKWRCPMSR